MNSNDYTIRLEKKEDYRKVENLVRESFWNVYRPGCSEHYVIHVLRDDPAFVKELDFLSSKITSSICSTFQLGKKVNNSPELHFFSSISQSGVFSCPYITFNQTLIFPQG